MKKTLVNLFTFSCCAIPSLAAANAPKSPTNTECWIAFMPLILFATALIIVMVRLKKSAVKLSSLLAEKEDITLVTVTPANPVNPVPPDAPQSISRLVVFLSGVTAIVLSVCLTTFYIYAYFTDPKTPVELSNLSTVLWGLGIGIIPYGFNKASAAIKS